MAILEDVFSAVNDDWSDHQTVHKRMDLWSPTSVRTALCKLARAGLIERREVARHPWAAGEYRRKQPLAPPCVPADPLTERQLFFAIKELSRRKPCVQDAIMTVESALALPPRPR